MVSRDWSSFRADSSDAVTVSTSSPLPLEPCRVSLSSGSSRSPSSFQLYSGTAEGCRHLCTDAFSLSRPPLLAGPGVGNFCCHSAGVSVASLSAAMASCRKNGAIAKSWCDLDATCKRGRGPAFFLAACSASAQLAIANTAGLAVNAPGPPSTEANAKCDYAQIEISEECPSSTGFNWEQYGEALYISRAFVFSGQPTLAEQQVLQLLTRCTTPFFRAFECPLAVAATYFALAQILAFQGRMRRALALVHMGFVFTRDKGFSECTPWPIQGWDMLLAGRNLAEKVRELDMQSVQLDAPRGLRLQGARIAVVTICAYAEEEPVRVISEQNHRLYTALHGYDLFFFTDKSQIPPHAAGRMDVTDGVHKPFFWKVNAVRNVLDKLQYDWVLWADCDAIFMDPERTLDSIIHMYSANLTFATTGPLPTIQSIAGNPGVASAILPGTKLQSATPVSLILAVDSTGINNGVWLLRNDAWARDFLDKWWHSDILQGAGKNHNCSDQSTMQHLLLQERTVALDSQWDAVEGPIWPAEVRVAAQEHLQSFHAATAATVLSREWQEGDFIKHHPGCHYYKEPCQQMYYEAALRFEDKVNQLRMAR